MNRTEIFEKLKEIIVAADESLAGKMPGVSEDTRILEDLGFTSVGMLFMAVVIEEAFSIQLEHVDIWSLRTLGDVIDAIQNLRGMA